MKYICAQPAIPYFKWQLEIMLFNFIEKGIKQKDIHILLALGDDGCKKEYFEKLQERYKEIRFEYYEDSREDKNYQPSIVFNLLKQHYSKYPELENEIVFHHDSDILFTKDVDFSLYEYDNYWHFSNTNSYIGYDYLISKGEDQFLNMCNIVGINPDIVKINKGGGAQYIIKNSKKEFWEKVEKDSINLYNYLLSNQNSYKKKNEHDYPIQIWTAGMWSLLWNSWLTNKVHISKGLDFCWTGETIERWNNVSIFHNAGVTFDMKDKLFFKGGYTSKEPFNDNFDNLDKDKCSWKYIEYIQKIRNECS